MSGALGLIFVITAIFSVLNALNEINRVKKNPLLGRVKHSKNLISFLFIDYE